MKSFLKRHAIYATYAAFGISLLATVGSLFLSEILHLPPCALCWYQRVFMYSLPFILGVGILRKDAKLYEYVLPLASVGWAVAFYHTLLQWKIIPDQLAPCATGISCTTVQVSLLGFITIPFMSLVAFTVVISLMLLEWKGVSPNESRS